MFDRYEFEQILDEDLACSRHYLQAEKINLSQQQSFSTAKIDSLNFRKVILIALAAGSFGLTVLHRPSIAQHLDPQTNQEQSQDRNS